MFLQFRAVKRDGFNGVWAAGRLFPSNEITRMEILDTEEDAPQVMQDLVENGRVVGQRPIHDMTKIGQKSLKEIRDDGRISEFPDGQADAVISPAELQAAKDALAAAEAQVADLTAKLAAATKERDEALAKAGDGSGGKSKK